MERRSGPEPDGVANTSRVAEETLSVAIVEDRVKIREGVALLLNATAGFRCSGSYGSMEQALEPILERPPGVVLVDLVLPGMTGVDGIRAIADRRPDLPLLVFTVYEDDDRVFEALCAGACGCVPKKTPPVELLETLRVAAAGGGGPMSPDCARRALELLRSDAALAAPGPPAAGAASLLELLSRGHNLRTAAQEMERPPEVVASMMREIYDALHAHPFRRGV